MLHFDILTCFYIQMYICIYIYIYILKIKCGMIVYLWYRPLQVFFIMFSGEVSALDQGGKTTDAHICSWEEQ